MSMRKPLAVAAATAACAALLIGATGTAATAATAPQTQAVAAAPQADPNPAQDPIQDLKDMLTRIPGLVSGAVPLPGGV